MIAEEIRDLSVEEIDAELDDAREEYMRLRFRMATGELTDHNQIKVARRLIARFLTVRKNVAASQAGDEAEGE
jgi:ribosomal protein L29